MASYDKKDNYPYIVFIIFLYLCNALFDITSISLSDFINKTREMEKLIFLSYSMNFIH